MADLLDMQDEIVSRIAGTLNAKLIAVEARRAEHSLHPDTLDLYFQGMARWNKSWTPEHMTQARGFFERALELDPDNVEALVAIAAVDAAARRFLSRMTLRCALLRPKLPWARRFLWLRSMPWLTCF
jgi:hypothetical protein